MILAIDPGTTHSAYVIYDPPLAAVESHARIPNESLLVAIHDGFPETNHCVIEAVASYGQPVGQEVFTTAIWCGRFAEAWDWHQQGVGTTAAAFIFRKAVKLHLCGRVTGCGDPVIRQRLIDLFSDGRGKAVAIGVKKSPGPLYGLKGDEFAALALAVTYAETVLGGGVPEVHREED
jgi:hypothetical protein